jgi:TPR repeat protein
MWYRAAIFLVSMLFAGQAWADVDACRTAVKREAWALAVQVCAQAARSGDVYAQRALGIMYYEGLGVRADMEVATRWLARAAAAHSLAESAAPKSVSN